MASVVEDPAAGGRIVSASVLLAHRLRLGDVAIPVGQIEYVATDPGLPAPAAGAGAVRRCTTSGPSARGDLAVLITGIPYLYRRFGYGYGLDYPPIHVLDAPTTVGDPRPIVVRPADGRRPRRHRAARRHPVRPTSSGCVRDRDSWRRARWPAARPPAFEQLVVAERDGDEIVGFAQLEARPTAGRLYVEPAMARRRRRRPAALLAHAVAQGAAHGELVLAFANPGTAYGPTLDELGHAGHHDHGIYVRVPDPVALLDALRPVLSERLAASRYADRDGELVISLYESGVALDLRPAARSPTSAPVARHRGPVRLRRRRRRPRTGSARWCSGASGPIGLERRVDDVTLGRRRRPHGGAVPEGRPSDVVGRALS